ncbi:hypothetical protein [Persephonella sp.]
MDCIPENDSIENLVFELVDDRFYTLEEIEQIFPCLFQRIKKLGIEDEEQWAEVFWDIVLTKRF